MIDEQREHLVKCIRDKLLHGGNISIYGWRDSNHNLQTRGYAKTGRIIFVERRERVVGVHGDLVVFTKYIGHPDQKKMRRKYNTYPHVFEIRTIISILLECADLIVKKEIRITVDSFDFNGINPGSEPLDLNELEKFLLETEVTVDKDNNYEKLSTLFKEKAGNHPDKQISSCKFGIYLKEFELAFTVKELISQGWIVPIKKENKVKISFYKPGEKLLERIDADNQEEPSDPIEKALFLRERRPHIEKMLEDLEEERRLFLEENDRKREPWLVQLERCKKSDELIALLNDV